MRTHNILSMMVDVYFVLLFLFCFNLIFMPNLHTMDIDVRITVATCDSIRIMSNVPQQIFLENQKNEERKRIITSWHRFEIAGLDFERIRASILAINAIIARFRFLAFD